MENSKTVSPKSGRGRLQEVVVYERFQYKAVTEDIFGVLGRCRLWEVVATGGDRTWRLDCKTIILLALAGYEMIIANLALRVSLPTISYPTCTGGIIVKYSVTLFASLKASILRL